MMQKDKFEKSLGKVIHASDARFSRALPTAR